jgi:hypothetical protein
MHSTLTEMLAAARRDQLLAQAEAHRRGRRAQPRLARSSISARSLKTRVISRALSGTDRPLRPAHAA